MSDKNYDLLLSKYNILFSRYKDLKEQYTAKQTQWENEEVYFKHIDDLSRNLCEEILAKDKDEMVLGTDYSWSSIKTDVLINKAINAFREYNKKRTTLMRHIMDLAENRQFQIDSLQDQIEQFMVNGNVSNVSSMQKIVEDAKKNIAIEAAKDKAPNKVKSAAASGKVELIIEDSDEFDVDGEMKNIRTLIDKNEQAKLTSHSIPTQDSSKKKESVKKEKDAAIMSHVVDLLDYEERMTDGSWVVLDVIGTYGISKYPEIEAKAFEISDMRKTKIRVSVQVLYKAGIISQECLKLPLSPKCFIYTLSDIGLRLYKLKFKKDAVESEASKIIKEHDNLAHGYGILDVEKILVESGNYKSVSCFNRSEPIPLKDGHKYIPDIICVTDRYKEYIEYERGTHKQADFNEKCNKMTQVTRYLNFVTPNKDVLINKLIPQVNEWIRSRDARSLKNIKIRLSTALSLRDENMKNDSCWQVIYDLRQGSAPIKTIE